MKIGLFGGTFNPFHLGHLKVAQFAKEQSGLDKIIFIPSATPPHKPGIDLAPASIRYDMVKKSIIDITGFEISDKELVRKGPSFTIDTIVEFKKEVDKGTQVFLLMGSDAFLDIPTWKDNQRILHAVAIIIMLRGNLTTPEKIATFVDEHISKRYTFKRDANRFSHEARQPIHICMVPKIDISSTMIRDRTKRKKSLEGLVPPAVETIIQTEGLYQ